MYVKRCEGLHPVILRTKRALPLDKQNCDPIAISLDADFSGIKASSSRKSGAFKLKDDRKQED